MIFLGDLKKSQSNYFTWPHYLLKNPITLTLNLLLLLSESFSINLASLKDELRELKAEHYELLNTVIILFDFGALYRNQPLNYSLIEFEACFHLPLFIIYKIKSVRA